jgi:hypothetical protein
VASLTRKHRTAWFSGDATFQKKVRPRLATETHGCSLLRGRRRALSKLSCRKTCPAPRAPLSNHLAPPYLSHPCAKPVPALAHKLAWLICPFHPRRPTLIKNRMTLQEDRSFRATPRSVIPPKITTFRPFPPQLTEQDVTMPKVCPYRSNRQTKSIRGIGGLSQPKSHSNRNVSVTLPRP